jgi:hypothetical protein
MFYDSFLYGTQFSADEVRIAGSMTVRRSENVQYLIMKELMFRRMSTVADTVHSRYFCMESSPTLFDVLIFTILNYILAVP